MNFYSKYLVGLVLLLSIVSCKKDLIEDPKPNETPIFKIDGIIGTEAFSATAGDDGFLMSTFIDQLHHVDVFSGKIANADLSFEVGFFNGDIDMEQGSITDALLQEILFANQPQSPLLTISKNQMPNSSLISSINWYVDGLNVSQNTINFNEPGNYNVGANVIFNDGTSATVYNNILVGYNRNVNCQLRHFLDQNGHLQAWIDESSQDISSVKWFLDGALVSTENKLDTMMNTSGHKVEAEILFVNGAKRKRTIWVDGGLNGKFIDDFASFEENSANLQWDYKTRLIFKKDGKTYTTLTANNQTSEFEVIDLSYYSTSPQGKPIYKIRANIECSVKEIATNEVLPLDATITFAIELK
jgi:hypothetical protein